MYISIRIGIRISSSIRTGIVFCTIIIICSDESSCSSGPAGSSPATSAGGGGSGLEPGFRTDLRGFRGLGFCKGFNIKGLAICRI